MKKIVDRLTAFLIDTGSLKGSGADNFRAYSHGLIGMSLMKANRASDAILHLRKALELCTTLADAGGIDTYLGQLYQAHRYLGQSEEAAGYADRMADRQSNPPDENWWRGLARLSRAAEPLLRMIARQGDRLMELQDVGLSTGPITALFHRKRPTLTPSEKLSARADKLASAGKLEEALDESASNDLYEILTAYAKKRIHGGAHGLKPVLRSNLTSRRELKSQ